MKPDGFQSSGRALLYPFMCRKSYQIQTSTFSREELDQMVAGLVNQRRSGQNKPLSAGLTATLSVFHAATL